MKFYDIETYYNDLMLLQNVERTTLIPLKNKINNIGIFQIFDNYEIKLKYLLGIIKFSETKFNRIYILTDNIDLQNNNICKYFSGIINIVETTSSVIDICNIINTYLTDNVYVLSGEYLYNSLVIPNNEKHIFNLYYNYSLKILNYTDSIFCDEKSAQIVAGSESSINYPVLESFVIPNNTFKQPIIAYDTGSLNSAIYLNSVLNNISIDFLYSNYYDSLVFDYSTFDKLIYKTLVKYKSLRLVWQELYCRYDNTYNDVDITNFKFNVVLLNSSNVELTIENYNSFRRVCSLPVNVINILDNIDVDRFENNIAMHTNRLINKQDCNILYNNKNQLFVKPRNNIANKFYGIDRFNKSLQYLIDNTEDDILVIIGDKILLDKNINFDGQNIWTGSLINGENTINYVNIFNVKKIKELNLPYNTFNELLNEIKNQKLPYEVIDPSKYGMVLPIDFDKYNGNIFRTAGLKQRLIFNYFLDNYNYNFTSYENDIWDNKF